MMTRAGWTIAASMALLSVVGAAVGGLAPRQDDEEVEETLMRGRHAFENNCLMCHAAPITASQRLSPEQWKTELTKMIGWGAPVRDEEREPLLAFLNRNYGEHVPVARPGRTTIRRAESDVASRLPQDDLRPTPNLLEKGAHAFAAQCASCHGADARGGQVGTNLVQKPILYRPAEFQALVREGRHSMPGFRQALDRSSERELLMWLRTK